MRIDRSAPFNTRPWIQQNTIHMSNSDSFSHIYVSTEDLIAADFFTSTEKELEWYFFLDGARVDWSELEDSQRLLIRVCAKQYWGDNEYKHGLNGYEDNRYYILEGLETS